MLYNGVNMNEVFGYKRGGSTGTVRAGRAFIGATFQWFAGYGGADTRVCFGKWGVSYG